MNILKNLVPFAKTNPCFSFSPINVNNYVDMNMNFCLPYDKIHSFISIYVKIKSTIPYSILNPYLNFTKVKMLFSDEAQILASDIYCKNPQEVFPITELIV